MSAASWSACLTYLREMGDNHLAQANAVVILQARGRWHDAVVARTSLVNLLFTLPGDAGYPFRQTVSVQAVDAGGFRLRWDGERSYEERTADVAHVDALLDAFLERLTSPTSTCRDCGGRVLVTARSFEAFERMHYGCFHYVFEHGELDRDEECALGGCPSAVIEPWHVLNDPRDALVAQLLDDLRGGDLAAESLEAQVEREGPGVISARFDEQRSRSPSGACRGVLPKTGPDLTATERSEPLRCRPGAQAQRSSSQTTPI